MSKITDSHYLQQAQVMRALGKGQAEPWYYGTSSGRSASGELCFQPISSRIQGEVYTLSQYLQQCPAYCHVKCNIKEGYTHD